MRVNSNFAFVQFNNPVCQGQAQAKPAGTIGMIDAVKRLEYVFQFTFGYPNPLVFHGNNKLMMFCIQLYNRFVIGRILAGIYYNIAYCQGKQFGIAKNNQRIIFQGHIAEGEGNNILRTDLIDIRR